MKTRTIIFSVLGVIVLMMFCFAFTIHILLLNIRNEYRKLNLGDKREEKDLEKIRDKIKKYYNQEEVTIVLTGYNREVNDPYGIW